MIALAPRAIRPVVASFALAFLLGSGLGLSWSRQAQTASVTVLGSGEQLSVVVSSGHGRLLIATGDDAAEFNNALSRVRGLTTRRLDLLLIAGANPEVPLSAVSESGTQHVFAIGPPAPALVEGTRGVAVLPSPRQINLGAGLAVTIEWVQTAEQQPTAWRAIVRDETATVVVLSDGTTAAQWPSIEPAASVLIVAGAEPLAALDAQPATTLIAAGGVVSVDAIRHDVPAIDSAARWSMRIFPGESVKLALGDDGISLPADAARPIVPNELPDPAATGVASSLPRIISLPR